MASGLHAGQKIVIVGPSTTYLFLKHFKHFTSISTLQSAEIAEQF